MPITGSVGQGGVNDGRETQYVQALLNVSRADLGLTALALDGVVGSKTVGAITEFQTVAGAVVDGRVDPGLATITALEALTQPIVPELRSTSCLALVLSYEPVEEEPQPEEGPPLSDRTLQDLVRTLVEQ